MILRSILVEGWRCFAAPVQVGPLSDGLNIVHGPNGIGKSTLMMALTRGLFDGHNVRGADIKALRPWGRSLAPKVIIEFEQGHEQFQLHKQFLGAEFARLDRKEGERFVPIAEGRAADTKAQILSGEAPARGASDHRHWGLAQILWASQGRLQIEQLASGTRATIQAALGTQVAGPGSDRLEKRIAEAYAQFFTAGGKLKSGASAPAVVGLEAQLSEALVNREALRRRLDEFDTASRRIEDLQRQTESATHSEQELSRRLKDCRSQAAAYQELAAQVKLHRQEINAAEESYRNLSERIESIRKTGEERGVALRELQRGRDDVPAVSKLVLQCQEEVERAEQSVKETRGRRAQIATMRKQAELAEQYTRTRQELAQFDKQIDEIDKLQKQHQRLLGERRQLAAPDKKTLETIRTLARQRDDAHLRLEAALVSVSIQPESDIQLEVLRGEETGDQPQSNKETRLVRGTPEVVFRVSGIGKILATGPTGDYEQLRDEWETAVNKLETLTAEFGTAHLVELEKRRAAADELDDQIAQAEVRINALLGGESLDGLRGVQASASLKLRGILTQYPDWKDSLPDPAQMRLQIDESESQFNTDMDRVEALHDRAQLALRKAMEKQAQLTTTTAGLESQVSTLERRLSTLREDGFEDEQRTHRLTEIALQRDTARGKLEAREELQRLGDDPRNSLIILEGQLEALCEGAADANRKLNHEAGRLEQIVSEAPYSALATLDDEICRLEEEVSRQRMQINAIRLLHETVVAQKSDVIHSILDPIRARANLILQRIAGTRFENIHFDESLLPQAVFPRSSNDAVALDHISGGEREQLYFAVRMALADVAFEDHRQLVVLDDVFTFTDTTRLSRIATILQETAERFQVVMLTCHPERYRGLPDAAFFDLEAIAAGA